MLLSPVQELRVDLPNSFASEADYAYVPIRLFFALNRRFVEM